MGLSIEQIDEMTFSVKDAMIIEESEWKTFMSYTFLTHNLPSSLSSYS